MKIFITFLLAFILSGLSYSQDKGSVSVLRLNVPCTTERGMVILLEEYQEKPMLHMLSHRDAGSENKQSHSTVLFVNSVTKTYTLVEKISDSIYCVISTGEGINVREN